jgi:hypothetical protein
MNNVTRFLRTAALALAACAWTAAHAFGPELRLSNMVGPSTNPVVAAVGTNVYVVWAETAPSATGQIYFSRSTDSGTTFSTPTPLTATPSRNNILPVIAAGGTQVYVFWTNDAQTGDIFYRGSSDSGTTFSTEAQLTTTDGYYSIPSSAIVDASGNLHFAFYDNRPPAGSYGQLYYQCKPSGGSFTTAVNITQFDGVIDNESPRLAQGTDGTLYALFRTTRAGIPQGGWPPFEQYMMRTTAPVTTCAGVSWLHPSQRVSTGLPSEFANTYGGFLTPGANNVLHAAYWSDKLGTNLYYRRGQPTGAGWVTPAADISQLGPNHTEWDGNAPVLSEFGLAEDATGHVHVVFGENNHIKESFQVGPLDYRCSSNDGVTWGTKKNATSHTETSQARAAYANGLFHMVWMDWIDNNSGAEIHYRNASAADCTAFTQTDLNGDGKSDLLYRNFTTGQIFRMTMNGFTVTNGATVYTEPNTAWKVVADADFNGDGVTDLLWRNTSTGQVFMQPFTTGGVPNGGVVFYTEPSAAWQIVTTADIDGDGKADIVWWNSTTGQVYIMIMNGSTITAQGVAYQEPNTAWHIEGAGDFAGSGKRNQLLWRNTSNGQVFMQTVTWNGGSSFSTTGQVVYNSVLPYHIISTGDFNGDGKSDILWRNDTTGQIYMLLMNGTQILSEGQVYVEPNTQWTVVSTGDYDGDGKTDILWRNYTTGSVFMQLMNGMTITSSATVYNEPNTAWRLLGEWEYTH